MNSSKYNKKNLKTKVKDSESIPAILMPSAQEITALMEVINQRQFEQAESLAQSMAMRFPLQVLGWKTLGNVLNELGKYEDALLPFKMVVILAPFDAEANSTVGLQLKLLGRFEEAEASCRLAVQLDPKLTAAYNNLGLTLLEMGQLDEAETCFLKVIEYDPNHSYAYNSLGVISSNLGRPNDDYFEKAISMAPDLGDIHSNWLYISTMSASVDATTLYNKHLRYAELFETPFLNQWQPHRQNKDPQRCLQIGFVSGDFCDHALTSFIEPLLIHLSKVSTLSLHAYYNHSVEHESTQKLKAYFATWSSVVLLNIIELADKVRADGIDILIDLSGHTAKNRLLSFARKPAPIQVSWMGYPGTTGLQAMDYYLTDRFHLPQELFKDQFIENLVYLPANAPFSPHVNIPDVNTLPALVNGFITFGSFNRPNKLHSEVVAVWAKLMLALPMSRLLLAGIPSESSYALLIALFAEHGIIQERLSFYPRTNMFDYLALHHQVDMCLDTFPYNGGTTTCHALSMGVPTLTLAGQTPASRTGALILSHVGLEDFIADNADDFFNKGLLLANDIELLIQLRSDLRKTFGLSAVQQPELIAKGVERALRIMWQCWCDDLPPISFDVSDTQLSIVSSVSES
jgi:predicted O-linked N-acetylglucosamine transferase (SPINDLY family)